MHPPISPTDLATLITEAALAARRLHRKMVLPAADLDDLRQDLLVDLICRLPGFEACAVHRVEPRHDGIARRTGALRSASGAGNVRPRGRGSAGIRSARMAATRGS